MPKNIKNFVSAELSSAEKRTLNNIFSAIDVGNLAHSYIIEGGSAASRFRCGALIACSLVCLEKNGIQPCLSCPQCRKILADEHTDIKFVGGDGADIKVDDVRALSKDAYIMPTDCDFHVYIIRDADRMNKNAQNALLKILEEPPANTVFVLLTASKEMLLPTVVSRAQPHTLGRSSVGEIAAAFAAKFPSVPEKTLKRAARLQEILDKTELDLPAIKSIDYAFDLVREFYVEKQLRINEKLPKNKDELVLVLSVLAVAARDIAVSKRSAGAETYVFERGQDFDCAAGSVSMKRAMDLYEAFSGAAERVRNSGNLSSVQTELFAAIIKK